MIIGIDIRVLAIGRKSGVQEYAIEIISRLVRLSPQDEFKPFFSSFGRQLPEYDWLKLQNVKVYRYRFPNRLFFVVARLFGWPKLDKLMGGADVFFSPHFFLAPLSPGCRRVTVFHDLSYERFPEFFTWPQRLWHRLMEPRKPARFSDRVIAVSASTKADLVKYYGLDPANISVIHNASSLLRPSEAALKHFKQLNHVPNRFVFSLGTLEPRKNIAGLIRAFNILRSKPEFGDLKLILAGTKGWKYSDVFNEMKDSPYSKDIIYLGYIEDSRAYYYSLASVFVYPSFFEGFGLPVLEAMSCGTPVVTSANSSMPEVAGDAAL